MTNVRIIMQSKENYLSVPKVARLGDGSLVMLFTKEFFGPPHDDIRPPEGELAVHKPFLTRSRDEGRTWSTPQELPEEVEGIPVTAGWKLVDGRDEVVWFGKAPCGPDSPRGPDGQPAESWLRMMRVRPDGDGVRLERPVGIAPMPDRMHVTAGLRASDGSLYVMYGLTRGKAVLNVLRDRAEGQRCAICIRRSLDSGRTWGPEIVADPAHLGGEKSYFNLFESRDGIGMIWTEARGVGDARLNPTWGGPQPLIRWSEDFGQSWGQRRAILPFRDAQGWRCPYVKVQDCTAIGKGVGSDLMCYARVCDSKVAGHPVFFGFCRSAVAVARSYDSGATWTDQEAIDLEGGGGDWGLPYLLAHLYRENRILDDVHRLRLGEAHAYGQMLNTGEKVLIVYTGQTALGEMDDELKVIKMAEVDYYPPRRQISP